MKKILILLLTLIVVSVAMLSFISTDTFAKYLMTKSITIPYTTTAFTPNIYIPNPYTSLGETITMQLQNGGMKEDLTYAIRISDNDADNWDLDFVGDATSGTILGGANRHTSYTLTLTPKPGYTVSLDSTPVEIWIDYTAPYTSLASLNNSEKNRATIYYVIDGFSTENMITAVMSGTEKTSTNFGSLSILGGNASYNEDGSLKMDNNNNGVGNVVLDSNKPVTEMYSINFTIKGDVPQTAIVGSDASFARTIVAISGQASQYMSWIGIKQGWLQVYSYYSGSALNVNAEDTRVGFMSKTLPQEYNQNPLNIQVTAVRNGTTKVYLNGEFWESFPSGNTSFSTSTLCLGDLRSNRNLRYIGSLYNFAIWNKELTQSEVTKNWNYTKQQIGL